MSTANLSYWEHQSFLSGFDVVIIGAGLVGLTTAIYTRQRHPHARIAVLERDVLPNGASTKNAGFACFGSISELLEQEKKGGSAALLEVVQARWEGLALLRSLIGEEALRYQPVGGYELFRSADEELAATCRQHIPYFNELLAPIIGTENIYRDATAHLPATGLAGVTVMLENRAEGALHTGRLMHALLKRAWQDNIVVLHSCPVTRLEPGPNSARLHTPLALLEAGQVVVATNAFSRQFFPELDVVPGRGQVLVTEPIEGLNLPGTFHYDKGYYYFRQVDGRILLGGGRNLDFAAEATTEAGLTSLVQTQLEKLLREVILPGRTPRIDYRWSGTMAFGSELAPIIRPLAPGVFGALRCNGMGVALGARTGQLAAEMLDGL
ncbi:NAD(P)/FAD-dependent oxidoreductase [Hymenobacter cellulosivorans]|uniref:FAD-binding oxidoreductase n=1 Tax=Hymenobacter cellulosivorans TaxID=2932249 RepID=A0ABY4FCJ2_9BACT|nr:FAD-binding oxidoreductase [Hymenobacter cellulosivorans]UOQ54208.1 FAD-binding oxidoreductase [Hymenobacter cellulosivorans]